ncbi:MAG TPA: VOC family protein, partial [Candidatus Binatia bacterium]|nr:VOC family protein [Candidatus Binatia bacterium]
MPIKISELDHIVLNVSDIHRSLDFYTRVLGLSGERVEEFEAGTVGFPSVRINQRTIIDLFP